MSPSLSPEHVAALAGVARLLAPAQGPWWVIAGAAAALHGAPVAVDDIDILLSAIDVPLVAAIAGVWRIDSGTSDRFRSAFYAASAIGTIRVEWMADFDVRVGGAWYPVLPRTREAVGVGGATVFVPDRAELIELLTRFGRPKDLARITLLTG